MSITFVPVSESASGLDAQRGRWSSSVNPSFATSPGAEAPRRVRYRSYRVKELKPWGLTGVLLALFFALLPTYVMVGTAFKSLAASQHPLSAQGRKRGQLGALPARQASIEAHFVSGDIWPKAFSATNTEDRNSHNASGALRRHAVYVQGKVSLLAHGEQQHSDSPVQATGTTQLPPTTSPQPQPSAGTVSTEGALSYPTSYQAPGSTVPFPLATASGPVTVTNPVTLSGFFSNSLPPSPVASPLILAPTTSAALSGGRAQPDSAGALPLVATSSGVTAPAGVVTPSPGSDTGLSSLPVPVYPVLAQPVVIAPGNAAGSTATAIAPPRLAPTLLAPSPAMLPGAIPAATSQPDKIRAPSDIAGVDGTASVTLPLMTGTPLATVKDLLLMPPAAAPTVASATIPPLAAAEPGSTDAAVSQPTAAPLPGVDVHAGETSGPEIIPAGAKGIFKATAATDQEGKTSAIDCNGVPVAVGSLLVFVVCLVSVLVETILMGNLFSKGVLSRSFLRGGGWIILLAAALGGWYVMLFLGLCPGLLIGGLVSSCWTMALYAGGGFMAFAVSIVLVGTRGAWLGALGGAASAATLAALLNPTPLPLSLGGVAGLLGGIVVGFVPILSGLEMNVRYIRLRMRSRAGSTVRNRSTSRGGLPYSLLRPKREALLSRESDRPAGNSAEGAVAGLRSSAHASAPTPTETSDERPAAAGEFASESRL